MPRVDLARLAEGYRHRSPSEASLARAETAGRSLAAESLTLDVGGGPGHHAAVWARQGHRPIVLDAALEMALPAVEAGISVVLGESQALPFRARTFGLVWFHLSLHYGDWRGALTEAVRVCGEPGRIEIWTLAADHHAASLLARWFPSIPRLDEERFPDPAAVERFLEQRTTAVERSRSVEAKRRMAGEWLAAAEAGFVSTLQLIDEDELETGLAAFRATYPDLTVEIPYELRFERIVATR